MPIPAAQRRRLQADERTPPERGQQGRRGGCNGWVVGPSGQLIFPIPVAIDAQLGE